MNHFVEFRKSIESSLDRWDNDLKTCKQAIEKHTPELLETINQDTAYLNCVNHIALLKNDLHTFNIGLIGLAKEQSKSSPEDLEKAKNEIQEKFDKISKELTSEMSTLLYDFAKALIKKEQESESFASKIGDIYRAALVDNTLQCDQSSSELVKILSSLINSKSFPEKYKELLTNIKNSLTTSLYSLISAQSALEYMQGKIESAQADAQEIISSERSTEETINKLIDELSDDFYIGKFIAYFSSLQYEYQNNQQLQAHIRAQLEKLASHYPKCEELQALITKWHLELNELDAMIRKDHKLDDLSKLNEQLRQFEKKLERGDYFEQAKKTILDYLPNCEKNIIDIVNENKEDIRKVRFITSSQYSDTIVQLNKKYESERDKVKRLLAEEKDNYSKYKSLSEILKNTKNIYEKINEIYTTRYELEEYHFICKILKGTSSQDPLSKKFIQKINTRCIKDPIFKRLADKLFFILMGPYSDQQQIDYFNNLTQFLETQAFQSNEATVLFEQILRERITEVFLDKLYQPKDSLDELSVWIAGLLRLKKNTKNLLLLKPGELDWINQLEKIIDDFENYKRDLDKIKYSYKANFFLNPSDKKKEAVENLQQRLRDLPVSTTSKQLESIFNEWEKDFGSVIDATRYKHKLINDLMTIIHSIQTLFSDKKITTKTRTLISNIKEQTQIMLETTQTPTTRRMG